MLLGKELECVAKIFKSQRFHNKESAIVIRHAANAQTKPTYS